jgi:hypothetical protein
MASRREEKERLRQQRIAAQRREAQSGQRRLVLGYTVAGLLAAAVVVGIIVVIASGSSDGSGTEDTPANAHVDPNSGITAGVQLDGREGTPPAPVEQARLEQAADAAGCDLQLDLPDEGNDHLSDVEKKQQYDTSPPTSGDHFGSNTEPGAGALADGAYFATPPFERTVHSLEHGRIEIQYSPDLPEEDQLAIKGVFDEDPEGMLLFPNSEMPYQVAVTAWTNMLGCDRYDGAATLDAIRAFRDTYRGQGPEPVPL